MHAMQTFRSMVDGSFRQAEGLRRAVVPLGLAASLALMQPSAARAAIPGYEVVEESHASTSGDKDIEVECPSGKVVLGTGFWGGWEDVIVDKLIPTETTVTAAAQEDENGYTSNWSIDVRAVCADDNFVAYKIVSERSPQEDGTTNPKHATATCPGGMNVLGVGWEVYNGNGEVTVTKAQPSSTSVTVTAHEDDTGTNRIWSVTAYAVCGSPIPGYEIVSSYTSYNSDYVKGRTTACPLGKVNIGAGFRFVGGGGNLYITQLLTGAFYQGQGLFTGRGIEDDDGVHDGTPDNWQIGFYAICAHE
jgi:hypothetical protein